MDNDKLISINGAKVPLKKRNPQLFAPDAPVVEV